MFVPLAVGEPDPLIRLEAVRDATANLKKREQALGVSTIVGLADYAAPKVLALVARAAHSQRFANLMVTNIPGPSAPLYCLGAKMLEAYPLVPLSQNLTINVAVVSYCEHLHFGIIGHAGDNFNFGVRIEDQQGCLCGATWIFQKKRCDLSLENGVIRQLYARLSYRQRLEKVACPV